MFKQFIEKRRLRKQMADIEQTLLTAFENLRLIATTDSPQREFEMGGILAALIGGLRDAYPNMPIEDESIAMALIESNAAKTISDSTALADTIKKLVSECPDIQSEKVDTTYFMIAPNNARMAKFGG